MRRYTIIAIMLFVVSMASNSALCQNTNNRNCLLPRGRGPSRTDRPRPVEALMERIKEENPEKYNRLQELRGSDRRAFREEIRDMVHSRRRRRFGRHTGPGAEPRDEGIRPRKGGRRTEKDDPRGRSKRQSEIRQLNRSIEELGRRYRDSDDEEKRSALKEEIQSKLSDLYDLRESVWQERIDDLERKLERMKETMDERKSRRDEILKRHLEKITSQ